MKIVGVEANCYVANGKNGVEVLTRFYNDDGDELTACVSDFEGNWLACVGVGFSTANSEPCEETVCEYRNRSDAAMSEYGKIFEMMADLSSRMKAF